MTLNAVCTGGASGIGRATSLALADRGVRVMVGDVDADGAQATARLIEQRGGVAHAHQVDVADEAQVEEFVTAATRALGPLSCAANVAGSHEGLGARTADVTVAEFDRQIAVNLRGMWLCVRAELRAMLDVGKGGAIVNVSSVNGLTAAEEGGPYAVAKHGILGLTKTAAVEYAKQGIRVNAVAPGLVDTPLTARMWDLVDQDQATAERELLASIPAGRMARADEIAEVIAWLCKDAPAYLTGATLAIDGGLLVRG